MCSGFARGAGLEGAGILPSGIRNPHSPALPVSDYEKIFLLLKQIQGTLDTRLIFLQNIIKEAARYRVPPPLVSQRHWRGENRKQIAS